MKLKDTDTDITLASASYEIKNQPTKHLYIHCAASKQKQRGYYGKLFNQIEVIAINNNCKSLRCKTGSSEKYRGVVEIHKKYGFKLTEQTGLDKQRERIGLEKQL
ncbi:MAG: hypothetical protein V1888_02485 [archaeon]